MTTPAILAEGLVKHYGDVKAIDGIDLEVPEGVVFGLLGPNGAGKTTTVRILTTLLKPDRGRALVGGHDVVSSSDAVRAIIGLTGQYTAVDEYLTGRENLTMIGRLYHLDKRFVAAKSEELLERFELTDAADRPLKTYSGGMRRRLDLAASLVGVPRILFLDEPTTGLDPRSRLGMWETIEKLVADGTTVLLTTQYLEEADQLASQIVVIDHGVVIAKGTSEELKSQVGGDRVEVVVSDPAKVQVGIDALQRIANGQVEAGEGRRLTAPVTGGSTVLVEAIRALDAAGVEVDDVVLRRPTLDDVFLTLTGHAAEEASDEQVPAGRGRKRGKK